MLNTIATDLSDRPSLGLNKIAVSPSQRKSVLSQKVNLSSNHSPSATVRHEPVIAAAEPKVYSPFKVRPGQGKVFPLV